MELETEVEEFTVYRSLAAMLSLALIAPCGLPQGGSTPTPPAPTPAAPTGGIKWETKKQCFKDVPMSDGSTAKEPVIWKPYAAFPNMCYIGYEVELTKEVTIGTVKKSKIKVWVLPKAKENLFPAGVDPKGWCHGVPFDDGTSSPGGEEVPFILAAGWTEYDWTAGMMKGDAVVFTAKKDLPNGLPKGGVGHSAKANGDGTYCSKNAYEKKKDNATKADMQQAYPAECWECKCYKPNAKSDAAPDDERPGLDARPLAAGEKSQGGAPLGEPERELATAGPGAGSAQDPTAGGGGAEDGPEAHDPPEPLRVSFHALQEEPGSSYGARYFVERTAEVVYVLPKPLIDKQRDVAWVDVRVADAHKFEVVLTLTETGRAKIESKIANSALGADLPAILLCNDECRYQYRLRGFLEPTVVVATGLEYQEARMLYLALTQ